MPFAALLAVAQTLKETRRALEPVLKPLEGEIRSELSMLELAKLSTMLLTYNLDRGLTTPEAARNYIAMQNMVLGAAMRAVTLPTVAHLLPEAARAPMVAEVLREQKAEALLKVLGHAATPSPFVPAAAPSFED